MKEMQAASKILIVDDKPSNVKILQDRLEDYRLGVAYSGEEALKKAVEFKPDLVMLDIMMPGLDGYEVCRRIRANPKISAAKIIMVSAKAMRGERLEGYKAGADDYVVKPFDGQELLAKVRVYLRLKSTEEFNDKLEKEVEERTKEIREAKEAAEAANQAKDKFVSTMTHELRNPLTSILGFADILKVQSDGPLNDKQLSYVNIIRQSADHLSNLVSDIFDVVKIDRDVIELNLSSFSPDTFVNSTVDMLQIQFDKKALKVKVDIDSKLTKLTGDYRRCRQILLNLLTNAIKYTDEGGTIEIRAEKNADSSAKISVIDSGVGISPEHQGHLFSEFYQVDRGRDEKLGGTGIGLALTHRLVKLHEGDISVESEFGKGSTFWFTLPITDLTVAEEDLEDEVYVTLPRSCAGRRVLAVDDNEVNQAILIEMLDRNDIEMAIANNGKEAVELAKYRSPDLILMDLRMPVMNGFKATEALRSMPEFVETSIIAMSADSDKKSVERCLDVGFTDHLSKPFDLKELNEILEKYLA